MLTMIEPMIGLEEHILFEVNRSGAVWKLKSGESLLIAIEPNSFNLDYHPEIPEKALQSLETSNLREIKILALVQTSRGDYPHTANLRAPLLVNQNSMRGLQVILEQDYPLQAPLPAT